MLAASPQMAYISEPLNVFHRPGVLGARVSSWYTYICDENESGYLPAFHELLNFRYHLFAEIKSLRSRKDFLRMGRDGGIFCRAALLHQRPLLKDPFAIFSIPWFAERLNSQIVVTIRHPAAFASSLKRLNWSFNFSDLLNQPLLMRDYLEPYRTEMQSMPADDIVGQAGLLWTMVYRIVHAARKQIPSICIVRHEDLSLDPVVGYRQLYAELGLNFTPSVERRILNPVVLRIRLNCRATKVHSVKLDSRANLDNWKRRLSSSEITRIRQETEEVTHLYYPEVAWN